MGACSRRLASLARCLKGRFKGTKRLFDPDIGFVLTTHIVYIIVTFIHPCLTFLFIEFYKPATYYPIRSYAHSYSLHVVFVGYRNAQPVNQVMRD